MPCDSPSVRVKENKSGKIKFRDVDDGKLSQGLYSLHISYCNERTIAVDEQPLSHRLREFETEAEVRPKRHWPSRTDIPLFLFDRLTDRPTD